MTDDEKNFSTFEKGFFAGYLQGVALILNKLEKEQNSIYDKINKTKDRRYREEMYAEIWRVDGIRKDVTDIFQMTKKASKEITGCVPKTKWHDYPVIDENLVDIYDDSIDIRDLRKYNKRNK